MAYGFNEDKSKAGMVSTDEYSKLCKKAYKGIASEGAISLENNQVGTIQLFDLPGAGTYIVTARLQFNGQAGGQRRVFLSINERASTWQNQCDGTGNDYLSTSITVNTTKVETVYIRALQNSGANCNVTASDISYVRLY